MSQSVSTLEILATLFFGTAVLHIFAAPWFHARASRYREGTFQENLFHFLGEVELVFGLWAGVFLTTLALSEGGASTVSYAEGLSFTEPFFVFAIMTVAATRPIIQFATQEVLSLARFIPLRGEAKIYASCMALGPVLGSLITEPAAMTLTAIILRKRYFTHSSSTKFRYVTLATLFVNISIGGVLTPFAAPPVLMVARTDHPKPRGSPTFSGHNAPHIDHRCLEFLSSSNKRYSVAR